MLRKFSVLSLAVSGSLFSIGANAQDSMGPGAGVKFDPQTINFNGVEVMPWIGLTEGSNSNVGLQSTNKTSTNFTTLNPNLVVGIPTKGDLYAMKYSGNFTRFASSSIDNFNDHMLGFLANDIWTARLNTQVNIDYDKMHDGRNALLFKSIEKWHTTGFRAKGHYGVTGAQGQFELEGGQVAKRYDTNNALAQKLGNTSLYNNDKTDLVGRFLYKVAPATQMFVEAGKTNYKYTDVASVNLNSSEQRYMLGVKWEATAKTTGNVKIGTLKKSFDTGVLQSGSGTVWDAEVSWTPLTYSRFGASLIQTSNEYGGTGSYIVNRDSNLNWTHDWTGRVSSVLALGDGQDKFQGASSRVDKRQSYSLKALYGFRTWLRAGLGYSQTRRNSTDANYTYTQGVTMLTLEGSL